jgi:RHS repeat-associated protein
VVDELVGGAVTRTYAYGLERISENQQISAAWTPSFYGYDGHGSVRQLTNSAGVVTDTYDYDAFAHLINSTGSTPNVYLFAGEAYDAALGLYYNRARYLNPTTGRFATLDSYEGNDDDPASLHKYAYTRGNPIDLVDPSGNQDSIAELGAEMSVMDVINSMAVLQTATFHGSRIGISVPSGNASQNNFFDSVVVPLSDPGMWTRAGTGMGMIAFMKKSCQNKRRIQTLTIAGHGWSSHLSDGSYAGPGPGIPGIQVLSDPNGYRGFYLSQSSMGSGEARPGETAYVSDLQQSVKSGDVKFATPCTIQIHACHISDDFIQALSSATQCIVVAAAGACQRQGNNWTSGAETSAAKKYPHTFKEALPDGSVEDLGAV